MLEKYNLILEKYLKSPLKCLWNKCTNAAHGTVPVKSLQQFKISTPDWLTKLIWSEMNTNFSHFFSRIVFREAGMVSAIQALLTSRNGWKGSNGNTRNSPALNVRHICLHSYGKISWGNLVELESGTASISVVRSTNWATLLLACLVHFTKMTCYNNNNYYFPLLTKDNADVW